MININNTNGHRHLRELAESLSLAELSRKTGIRYTVLRAILVGGMPKPVYAQAMQKTLGIPLQDWMLTEVQP